MKILLCHNFYQQAGGEDQSFAAEASLLESHGHQVLPFTIHNDVIHRMTRLGVARRTLWSRESYRALRRLIRCERPSIMHCTNIFPLISPSAYYAARAEGAAVVQSLRNFRLFCANAFFFRHGTVCEDCLKKKFPWPGILRGCYRNSRSASAVLAAMLGVHRLSRTWSRQVHRFFTLTEFARQKFIEGGFAGRLIAVKPNFIHPDPGSGTGDGRYAVFVGRLSPEKGLNTVLTAWRLLAGRIPLKIIGDGPMAEEARAAAAATAEIDWLGKKQPREVLALLGGASFLVMPSVGHETFGRTVIEAYAKGTPVVGSRLGAVAELVEDGRSGSLFTPGDPEDLARTIKELTEHPSTLAEMRREARRQYEEKYTAETNYRMLMTIYEEALAASRNSSTSSWCPVERNRENTQDDST
jgi:glycosyltransferase involved in cell wall biosynthesis